MRNLWKNILRWVSSPLSCKIGVHEGRIEYTLAEGAWHVCDGCGKVTR